MENNDRFLPGSDDFDKSESPSSSQNAGNGGGAWPAMPQVPNALPKEVGQNGGWPTAPRVSYGQAPPPVIPFHPLNIGELFSGTFAAIRSNPKVMFTFSVVTMMVVGLITGIVNAVLTSTVNLSEILFVEPEGEEILIAQMGTENATWYAVLQPLQGVFSSGAGLLISGMLILAVTGAVVDLNRTVKGTWAALKPRFWPLVGTTILSGLIIFAVSAVGALAIVLMGTFLAPMGGVIVMVIVPIAVALIGLIIWVSVRLFMAPMITVVEEVAPVRSLKRSWEVTAGGFWRLFGRLLLLGLVAGAATSLMAGVVSLVFLLLLSSAPLWLTAVLLSVALSAVAGLVHPVTSAYTALMYVDERIRKEDLAPSLEEALAANREAGR